MKRILYVASTYSHILNFHVPHIKRLLELGNEVHIAAAEAVLDGRFIALWEYYEGLEGKEGHLGGLKKNLKFIDVPFRKKMFSLQNLKCMMQLKGAIKSKHYDIVHTHTSLAAFFTRMAVLFLFENRPVVINTVHGYLFDLHTPWLKRQVLVNAEKMVKAATDVLVVMNEEDYRLAEKYRLFKGSLIYSHGMGIDTWRFSRERAAMGNDRDAERGKIGISSNDTVLIYAAEFSKRKNQKMLIESMCRLPEDVKLLLAGRGGELEACIELARSLCLTSGSRIMEYNGPANLAARHMARDDARVMFLGHVKDLENYYYLSDICVSASRSEGLPFNIMEAMAMGLPVIATNVKGHQDLIEGGVNGYLYEFGSREGFVNAVLKVLKENKDTDGKAGLLMAQNNIEKAQQYSVEKVQDEVMGIYRDV